MRFKRRKQSQQLSQISKPQRLRCCSLRPSNALSPCCMARVVLAALHTSATTLQRACALCRVLSCAALTHLQNCIFACLSFTALLQHPLQRC